ncbi:MAG TPA: C-terminal binding protein [Roseiflexaceae bacterium]|nr:C-terminal binding protein [Roseiflexaceae bacterium]
MSLNVVIASDPQRAPPAVPQALARLDVAVQHLTELGSQAAALLRQADGVIVEMHPLSAEQIEQFERCRVIACASTGYDYVDIAAATRRGIWVTNAPEYCTDEVATHTIALLLNQARRLPQLRALARGSWQTEPARPIVSLRVQTLGIIGCGRIGRAVAAKALPLGMQVLGYDPYVAPETLAVLGIVPAKLHTLLRESDYVSLHVPLTDETRGMFDEACCAQLKPGAYLINTSRGAVVDEQALLGAVQSGHLAGAALDVLASEPPPPDHPFLHDERFFVTPHAAWCSEQADQAVWEHAALNVACVLRGDRPPAAVNNLPDQMG